ncbi:unnamed protein product [Owenia fusiformis]|uniref:Uncharacterized protein n=1 Tax=Owenia fusiformis TaxID=6347 RepID=A0A8S4P562_OWEFU|nr:unnamed protein product [Owenia fusiformis]
MKLENLAMVMAVFLLCTFIEGVVPEPGSCRRFSLKQQVSMIEDEVSFIKDKVSTIEHDISTMKTDITTIKDGISHLGPQIGDNRALAANSCLEILQKLSITPPSGLYHIRLSPYYTKRLYCDMVTYGGGFTLVWTFTFTNYSYFSTCQNAVTPRPNWNLTKFMSPREISNIKVPVSRTPPESEEQLGALDFKYWKLIGHKCFIVKSNIINWILCKYYRGSFVEEGEDGRISCRVIKVVSTDHLQCKDVRPGEVRWHHCGLDLQVDGYDYLQFDVNSELCIPTWDPCGQGQETRYVKDVDFPHGNVYIR